MSGRATARDRLVTARSATDSVKNQSPKQPPARSEWGKHSPAIVTSESSSVKHDHKQQSPQVNWLCGALRKFKSQQQKQQKQITELQRLLAADAPAAVPQQFAYH